MIDTLVVEIDKIEVVFEYCVCTTAIFVYRCPYIEPWRGDVSNHAISLYGNTSTFFFWSLLKPIRAFTLYVYLIQADAVRKNRFWAEGRFPLNKRCFFVSGHRKLNKFM